jgi:hypothetical protein
MGVDGTGKKHDTPAGGDHEPPGGCGPATDTEAPAQEEPAWVKDFEEENPMIMDLVRCGSVTFV